jgi:hypothetical protein
VPPNLQKPRERDTKNINTGCIIDELIILRYKNLDITINENGSVSNISTTSLAYPTTEGIRVGDSIRKFKSAYQKYQYEVNEGADEGDSLVIRGKEFYGFKLFIRHGKIISTNASLPVCD